MNYVFIRTLLLWLQSCDDMYDTLDQQIHHGCQQQLINNSRTVYLWEVSVDEGVNFYVLNASSVFTSPDSRELQTLYLDPGMYVRCRVKAVDQEGQGVYWRTSETVLLNSTRYQCYSADLEKEKGEHIGFLTSYNSFGAFEQVCECGCQQVASALAGLQHTVWAGSDAGARIQ